MSVVYVSEPKNIIEMDEAWNLFLNTTVDQLRVTMKKNTVQVVEQNRSIPAEALMKIGPNLIREFAQMTIVQDYRDTLFYDFLVKIRPRPASLKEMRLADCLFDTVSK